jgi:adhesin transport system outer membrane protein
VLVAAQKQASHLAIRKPLQLAQQSCQQTNEATLSATMYPPSYPQPRIRQCAIAHCIFFTLPLIAGVSAGHASPKPGTVTPAGIAPSVAVVDPTPDAATRMPIGNLSLQQAVGIAISRHPDISRAGAVVAQSASEVEIAKAAWFPKLEYGIRPGHGTGPSSSIGINQLVYDFGRTKSRISAADATLNRQRYLLADTIETVASTTAATFVELAASQDVVAAAKRQVAALRETRVKINDRVRAGLSVTSDRNLIDVAVLRAEAEVLKADTRFDIAAAKLAELTGIRPRRVADLSSTASFVRRLGNGIGGDIEQTPSVRAATAAVDAADARLSLAEADRFPSVGVGISRSRSIGSAGVDNGTWVGISLTGNFSLSDLAQHQVAAAEADRRAAREALENQRLISRTTLHSAEMEEAGAASRLSSYEKVIELSRASRDLYWQEYILGKRSLTEVVSPERDIFQSEVEWTNALADGMLARLKTYIALGRFAELLHQREGSFDE